MSRASFTPSHLGALAATAAIALAAPAARGQIFASSSLADMTLEQLSNVTVTSVSGRAESLQDAPASIFVITAEAIRRSAATSLPEALRLAPNLLVAQLNAAQYSISARGFNNAIGNKLLVLIDGRTVYSPLFSGTFWDANDVMLEDVERIEVISGPGGTIWGANAVNGVINVITRPAADTQGALASVARSGNGGFESARYGGRIGEAAHYRIYAMAMDHGNTSRADGFVRPDAASKQQTGFRMDWANGVDRATVQGDAYTGGSYPANNLAPRMTGANLLARWTSAFADGSPYSVQAYLDYADRDDVTGFVDTTSTADLTFTHEPAVRQGHKVLWGAGIRHTHDMSGSAPVITFIPATRNLSWANLFMQDKIRVSDRGELTLGAKIEHNVYTGFEFLPTARFSFAHTDRDLTWASLSRAVRAPARLDRDFYSPAKPPFFINGGPMFRSEIANVAEIGHRGYAGRMSYSVTAFHQRYDHLRSGSSVPVMLVNQIGGSVSGVETWGSFQATEAWRLSAGYLALREHLSSTRGTPDPAGVASLGNDPRQQWSLKSTFNLGTRGDIDLMLRHVGSLPSPFVEAYTALDARVALQVTPAFGIEVLAQNLLDRRHVEFNAVGVASQIERRFFIKATWRQ